MRALLIYPKFPSTFWSYEGVLRLVNRKVLMPPLGLVTVAALLPPDWELKLVDVNVRPVSEDEWRWADVVLVSAMIAQRDDFARQIAAAKARGKRVAVGGPYPTALPQYAIAAGADYLVLDEGEITIPKFLDALAADRAASEPVVIRANGEKPDLSATPIPRFELLDLPVYDMMAVQFSRGCPFLCDFCDIIELYGRRPRTKPPARLLAELDRLYELGWRRAVFIVDDNFIGHKPEAKRLMRALRTWQAGHNYVYRFNTEASIDLAQDPELIDLMVDCQIDGVFIGVETPDVESLASIRKHQNTRRSQVDSLDTITRAGIRVMVGVIVGFDGERPGASRRIAQFVEDTAVPTVLISVLTALPDTTLWKRLEAEGRLIDDNADVTPLGFMNFVPERPIEEIAREYLEIWDVYDPIAYLDRTYRYFLTLGAPRVRPGFDPAWSDVRAIMILFWRQGVVRGTRWKFWHHLVSVLRRNPHVADQYLVVCAHNEHFLEYRARVRDQVQARLAALRPRPGVHAV